MIHSKTLKKNIIIMVSLLSVISFTGCTNIKFIEKVPQSSEQSIESNTSDNLTIPNTTEDDIEAWRTQTMSETSLSKDETSKTSKDYDLELPIITTTSYYSQIEDNETSVISSKSETNNNVSEDFSESDEYYKYIEPVDIVFVKKTSLYKNSRDLEPFTVQSGQNALLIGHTIDSKWDIIKFSGNKFLIMARENSYIEADEVEENLTERTTVPTESESIIVTTETSAPITSPTTSITTQEETTTTTTTATTTVITTQETAVTTTQQYISSVVTTTPQQITETTTTTVSSNEIHTTGNKGGIPFPDDTSKTSKVFGITFVNMEEMVVLVNDVYVSSGPGEPNDYNGYINLGIIEEGTELKCLGMSYDGWLRLRLPNNKIGFVQDVNAILANNF